MSKTIDGIRKRVRAGVSQDVARDLRERLERYGGTRGRAFWLIMEATLQGRLTPLLDTKMGEAATTRDLALGAMKMAEEIADTVLEHDAPTDELFRELLEIEGRVRR